MKNIYGLLPGLVLSAFLVSACDRDRPATGADAPGGAADSVADRSDELAPAPPPPRVPVNVPVKPDSGQSFTDLDKNMDSGISRDELARTEMLYQHFNEADSSGDGKLSYAEMERHREDMGMEPQAVITDGRSVNQMDKNGDGGISRDELWNNEMLYRHFDEADKDRDGRLAASEVDAHRAAMASGD
ncbi:MAG: EF-hand domain-containing protein [Pseudomonadota bacterium]|nr:EF-hand domain-containing protein [Pseudomonadota bacterium]MDQ3160764.1 EF-hand domain-containing protein [Pseudomonadota bacterium]